MNEISIIGLDLAKNVFQAHGAGADGSVLFRRKLSRAQLLKFLSDQQPCVVAMEACASAHHWGRAIGGLGHEVRLIPVLTLQTSCCFPYRIYCDVCPEKYTIGRCIQKPCIVKSYIPKKSKVTLRRNPPVSFRNRVLGETLSGGEKSERSDPPDTNRRFSPCKSAD